MYTHHIRNLHVPMFAARRGLRGALRGLRGTVTLKTDKQAYLVGDAPIYQILGGAPGASIVWTSFKDGSATGEYQVSYGQSLGAEGRGVYTAAPWTDADVGLWEKQAILSNPDGTTSLAQVFFTVSKPAGSGTPLPPKAPGFFDKQFDFFGSQVSGKALLAFGGIGLFLLMGYMKGR